MRIFYTVVYILTEILSDIELSSPFECLPNGAPILVVPHHDASSSLIDTQHSSASASVAEGHHRSRSRSPPTSHMDPPHRLPSSDGHGYELDQLRFIRLTPSKNPHRQFELRRYTFPTNERIKVFVGERTFQPVSPREHIVLSTHEGDVFAILTSDNTLAGIYELKPEIRHTGRAKINMETGRITQLIPEEIEEVPVGHLRSISHTFRVEHINQSCGSHSTDEPRSPDNSMYRSAMTLPNVLGYELQQLHLIRLRSKKNPHRQFGVRRYTFAADTPIKIRAARNKFRPIPVEEQIIISTFSGDVFAIFETSYIIAGIYAYNPRIKTQGRVMMNMVSGKIAFLTADEVSETPVGTRRPVSANFIVDLVDRKYPGPQNSSGIPI